jgi:hypothetical protein
MSDIHPLGSGFKFGGATITPTDGFPAGEIVNYNGLGMTLDAVNFPPVNINFGHIDISATGSLTDGSNTITTADTSQEVFAELSNRNYFYFSNISNHVMYVNFGENADTTSSYKVSSGEKIVFESGFVPSSQVNVICGTQGAAFVAKQA